MDLSKQFSLADFLAYFFPGLFATIGIFLLLLVTPVQSTLASISTDFITGAIFLALSYVVGVIISGFSMNMVNWISRAQNHENPRGSLLPVQEFQDEVSEAFKDIFGKEKAKDKAQWSKTHFYMCRSLILDKMPAVAQRAERQSSLRQLRGNLILPIFIWIMDGIGWGISSIKNGVLPWGVSLVIFSVLLGFITLKITLTRMYNNEVREIREVLTGFLAGYRTGVFDTGKTKQAG
jgi:hypothetical protein